jgi:hypothetical protein
MSDHRLRRQLDGWVAVDCRHDPLTPFPVGQPDDRARGRRQVLQDLLDLGRIDVLAN